MAYSRLLKLTDPLMYGLDVKEVQAMLKKLYYKPGTIDGWYGSNTYKAVKRFQQRNSITIDGIVGPVTWKKLFSTSAVLEAVYRPCNKYDYLRNIPYNLPITFPPVIHENSRYSMDIGVLNLTYEFSYRKDHFSSFNHNVSFTVSNGVPTSYNISSKCASLFIPLSSDAENMFNNLCVGIGNGTIFAGFNGSGSIVFSISQHSPAGYIYHEITIKGNNNLRNAAQFAKCAGIVAIVIILMIECGPSVVASLLGLTTKQLLSYLA